MKCHGTGKSRAGCAVEWIPAFAGMTRKPGAAQACGKSSNGWPAPMSFPRKRESREIAALRHDLAAASFPRTRESRRPTRIVILLGVAPATSNFILGSERVLNMAQDGRGPGLEPEQRQVYQPRIGCPKCGYAGPPVVCGIEGIGRLLLRIVLFIVVLWLWFPWSGFWSMRKCPKCGNKKVVRLS